MKFVTILPKKRLGISDIMVESNTIVLMSIVSSKSTFILILKPFWMIACIGILKDSKENGVYFAHVTFIDYQSLYSTLFWTSCFNF